MSCSLLKPKPLRATGGYHFNYLDVTEEIAAKERLGSFISARNVKLRMLFFIAAAVIMDSISIRAELPVKHAEIREGAYAVRRYKGPYANMKAAYQWLYGTWLPNSGRDAADAPGLEEYLNSPRDTAPGDLLTEIWLPIR